MLGMNCDERDVGNDDDGNCDGRDWHALWTMQINYI